MALFAKEIKTQNTNTQQAISQDQLSKLNLDEIAFLLEVLKKSTFIGENVELVYNTAFKLQSQYLEQSKQ